MGSAIRVGCGVVGVMVCAVVAADDSVRIEDFRSQRVINAPGRDVALSATVVHAPVAEGAAPAKVTAVLTVQCGLGAPAEVARRNVALRPGRTALRFAWKPGQARYGVAATLTLVADGKRTVARARALFEVVDDWTRVMRLGTIESYKLASPNTSDREIERLVLRARQAGVNTIETYAWMPASYDLTPDTPDWADYSRRDPKTRRTAAAKLALWSRLLHANGMKFIMYNEMQSFRGKPEWRLCNPYVKPFDPANYLAAYYRELGYFTPNFLHAGDLFGREVAGSIRRFDWDGILMDSCSQGMQATGAALDRHGKRITDLSPGEIGRRFMLAARKHVGPVKPAFKFISQNIQSSIIGRNFHYKRPIEAIFPTTQRFYAREQWGKYSSAVDMWSSESTFESMADGRYAGTYDRLAVTLNTAVELSGKPLLVWSNLAGPANRRVSYVKPLMAALLASRSRFNEHYEMYGGATTGPVTDPVNAAIRQYRQFALRYGELLYDPDLEWDRAPWRWMTSYRSPTTLMWERTVYTRTLADGARRIVVHLLNLPGSPRITDRHQVPTRTPFFTMSFAFTGPKRPVRGWLLPADAPPERNWPGLDARAPSLLPLDPIATKAYPGEVHSHLDAVPGAWSVSVPFHAERGTSPLYWSVLVLEVAPTPSETQPSPQE